MHAVLFASKTLALQMRLTSIVKIKTTVCTNSFLDVKVTRKKADLRNEGRSKESKKKDLEESRAAVPFGFHVVLPDMRGSGSTGINSCYITSLCWCQVAERKGRKESAMTLFFSVVRPHLALLLLCLIPLRVCLYGYRRVLCLPNTTGVSLRCSSLFSLAFSFIFFLLLSLHSHLDHHVLLHP